MRWICTACHRTGNYDGPGVNLRELRCPRCRLIALVDRDAPPRQEKAEPEKKIEKFDLDPILAKGKVKNFIYRVGVELEGGWVRIPDGIDLAHDGSIRGISDVPPIDPVTGQYSRPPQGVNVGELNSEPMETEKVLAWMRQSYPSHVNDTCGLHVHMSFKSALHYMWLMVPEFQETVRFYLRSWGLSQGFDKTHPLLKRLQGKNQYCKNEFHADVQATNGKKSYNHDHPGHRYTMINYPFGLHGTMECRVLPMFPQVEQGYAAVQRVLDITNASIQVAAQKEEAIIGRFDLDSQRLIEEFEEHV